MRTTFTVYHNEHVSTRPFDEVINAFESAVGSVEDTGFPALLAETKNPDEFEASGSLPQRHERVHALSHGRSWGVAGPHGS